MTKKHHERNALGILYKPGAYHVEEAEAPDFVLRSRLEGISFGVEVTDLYESEVEARLDRIPSYGLDLIQGKPFRHKVDEAELLVDDVVFTSPDGSSTVSGRAVGRRSPLPFSEYLERLARLIADKNAKARTYRADLRHVNLIIVDQSSRLMSAKPEGLHRLLFTDEVREAVLQTPFREISLITSIENERRMRVPLRMYLAVSIVVQLPRALRAFKQSGRPSSNDDPMVSVSSYLQSAGVSSRLVETTLGLELITGDASIRWDSGHLRVHDLGETDPHLELPSLTAAPGPWDQDEFHLFFAEYQRTNGFALTVAFDT
jgi:hypothetical protein